MLPYPKWSVTNFGVGRSTVFIVQRISDANFYIGQSPSAAISSVSDLHCVNGIALSEVNSPPWIFCPISGGVAATLNTRLNIAYRKEVEVSQQQLNMVSTGPQGGGRQKKHD